MGKTVEEKANEVYEWMLKREGEQAGRDKQRESDMNQIKLLIACVGGLVSLHALISAV